MKNYSFKMYSLKSDKKNNLLMVIMNTFMNENFRDVS